jgi:uncharacterized protein YqeY
MSLKAKLGEDLKEAMRAKDTVRLDTIRSIRAAITQREVDAAEKEGVQKELDDAAIVEIVRSLRKQRLESIEQYNAGGRSDLAEKEVREKELLEAYLPAAPDAAAVEAAVRAAIAAVGATSPRDMGKVMTAAKEKLGSVDGKALSEVVKRLLSGG